MGSLSAMSSLNRVLKEHGEELQAEYMQQVPDAVREQVTGVVLVNNTYHIDVLWQLHTGATLDGPSIDIDDLQERYPDCEVGY